MKDKRENSILWVRQTIENLLDDRRSVRIASREGVDPEVLAHYDFVTYDGEAYILKEMEKHLKILEGTQDPTPQESEVNYPIKEPTPEPIPEIPPTQGEKEGEMPGLGSTSKRFPKEVYKDKEPPEKQGEKAKVWIDDNGVLQGEVNKAVDEMFPEPPESKQSTNTPTQGETEYRNPYTGQDCPNCDGTGKVQPDSPFPQKFTLPENLFNGEPPESKQGEKDTWLCPRCERRISNDIKPNILKTVDEYQFRCDDCFKPPESKQSTEKEFDYQIFSCYQQFAGTSGCIDCKARKDGRCLPPQSTDSAIERVEATKNRQTSQENVDYYNHHKRIGKWPKKEED